jgi:hypothetical protein
MRYHARMRKLFVAILSAGMLVCGVPRGSAQAYEANPKLVVILVIDQFRGDYLDRYRASLTTENGFNLFLKKGAYFNDCYFDYANTKTAPGARDDWHGGVHGWPWHRVQRVVGSKAKHGSGDLVGGGRAISDCGGF